MLRKSRNTPAGYVYHVINLAPGRMALYREARDWLKIVNTPQSKKELDQVRLSVTRSRPYGDGAWTRQTANALDLEHTLRNEGRPPKAGVNGENG